MLITNHALAGAVIGLVLPRRPGAAAALGVASHFALDVAPHWGAAGDHRWFRRVAFADGLCGLATVGIVARVVPRRSRPAVIAAMFGACLPDVDKPAEMFFGRSPLPPAIDKFHAAIQHEAPHRMRQEVRLGAALGAVVALFAAVGRR